uniref:Major facilitator superfamily-related transporter, putative n=1 Tax=Plasmodium malariae TaxID=5858 RepID=A0A1C3L012_PLAMA|nr:major facilitator superfamily-related transporter, putative [Plasmodium malariae]
MNSVDNKEVSDNRSMSNKDEFKEKSSSSIKINLFEEEISLGCLSNINRGKLERVCFFLGLEKYIKKLKKTVNRFYFIYVVVTLINFLIYLNRGIIPGSYDYLSSYLKEVYATTNVDVHIGFLTSVFVFGLSINSVISGSLASSYSVFRITDIFLFQNSLALLFTGLSFIIGSYYSLMFSRFFCGFSEAAFTTIIPPLIYSYSKDRAGSWISIFITMFPLGGCIGYLLAVVLPVLKVSIAQYFIFSGILFLVFTFLVYLFDENLLKKYEDEKSRKEMEVSNKAGKDLEEGIALKNDISVKDANASGGANSGAAVHVDASKDNKQKSSAISGSKNKTNASEKNKKEANPVQKGSNKNKSSVTSDSADANGANNSSRNVNISKSNRKNVGSYDRGRRGVSNGRSEEKESENGRNNSSVHTNSSGNVGEKDKNKNTSNSRNSMNNEQFGNLNNLSLSKLKNSSSTKSVNSVAHSKNRSSTDFSDQYNKMYEENTFNTNNKRKDNSMYDEEILYQVDGTIDDHNINNSISYNSTQKNFSDNNNTEYMNENDMGRNVYEEEGKNINNNSYINNNIDKIFTMQAYGSDELYLNTTQESNGKGMTNVNKFLEMELDNCIESIDEDKNDDLNMNVLIYTTLTNVSFLLIVLVLTAHIDMIQCYLVYGAPILYALKIFPSYKTATITCSLCACMSSILGTCFGGYLVDFYNLNIQNIDINYEHIKNNEKKIKKYSKDVLVHEYLRIIGFLTLVILIIATVLLLLIPFITNMYIFTVVMTLGLTSLFSILPGCNIGVMVCVPRNIRAFSIGMSSFISHLLGDIPWTIIIGKIKGTLSPDCVVTRNGEMSERCYEQSWGLRMTLLIICSKALVMAMGSFLLYVYSKYKSERYKSRQIKA